MSHRGRPNPLLQSVFAMRLVAGISILFSVFGSGCDPGAIRDPRAFEACTPNCATRVCGADGCGGSCGTCEQGQLCDSRGTCYDPTQCTPDCLGRECGSDGCGGSCGTCLTGDLCNAAGACYDANQCTPLCAGKECGDDACGGTCGNCALGELCDAIGTCYDPNQCAPDCAGKECGGDGCGGSCGICATGELCNGGGACYTPNHCAPVCAGKECGDDACGGSCGNCASGEFCNLQGTCYQPNQCTPNCTAQECGDDGCGGSCGTCTDGETCNNISGLCAAPVGLVWTDSIQSGTGRFGFDWFYTEYPIGHEITPSDANGANLSRVPDPLGGPGYAVRQYGLLDENGARSQLGIFSFSQSAFRDLALSGAPVYVAQEWYFPETIEAGGDPWPWLSLIGWHTTRDGSARWDTSPGIILKQDGSMKIALDWGAGPRPFNGDLSDWSRTGMPVGEWFDIEMRWEFATGPTGTVSVWINGELALQQTGVVTALAEHNVVEFYIIVYGSDQGHTPWSPRGTTKYVRNVRISGERIWR